MQHPWLDTVIRGDCTEILPQLPEQSVDLIFADPPYYLQLQEELWRPNLTKVDAVDEAWDQFSSFEEYDSFCLRWLEGCRRVLKDDGTLWVIGSYHNIFRIGKLMQDLGFWILNSVIWVKANPMPNFRGRRLTHSHEILIWAVKHKDARYQFHYKTARALNDDRQLRAEWHLPLCTGRERVKIDGKKAHPTQKPEALLYRIITLSSQPGDVVLDPFLGTGTTAVVAKRLRRHYIGIEQDPTYCQLAIQRLERTHPVPQELIDYSVEQKPPRVPFGVLVEQGYLQPGETLRSHDGRFTATVLATGMVQANGVVGSIHRVGSYLMGKPGVNGWKFWHVLREGEWTPLDAVREAYRQAHFAAAEMLPQSAEGNAYGLSQQEATR
ncbi:Modification methylase DpnIIB [bacterium HR14]|nr:Modification methylase DpnIIB [bacterium HR14]